jgi:predicted translin family RNA/ssDNA-binding protein
MNRRVLLLPTTLVSSTVRRVRSSGRQTLSHIGVVRNPLIPTVYLLLTTALTTTTTRTASFSSGFSPITTTPGDNRIMPQPPFPYRSPHAVALDLSDLESKLCASDKKRREAYDVSRTIQIALVRARNDMELSTSDISSSSSSSTSTHQTVLTTIRDSLLGALERSNGPVDGTSTRNIRSPREANLGHRVEEFVRLHAFQYFLQTGSLLPPSECSSYATDEEYLAGACMGLCQDLSRYAMGAATARDVTSVRHARNVVNEILDYLLQFDFRNGYLRRKYDGTKYCLKTLETLLYELSVTGASVLNDDGVSANNDGAKEPQPNTSLRDDHSMSREEETTADESTRITAAIQTDLDAIRHRMEHRDELRESLIKKCRDGQKAAKQAIYALHRGDLNKCSMLLNQCEKCISHELVPIVEEEPSLRGGSFSNVLEEFVEAKMFAAWLGVADVVTYSGSPPEKGTLLLPQDFGTIPIEAEEYLGGLCDLTGEIGRYAVQRGTNRDYEGVQACLEANAAVALAIQTLERSPSGINKKMEQLQRSVEKLERMTYEMSLSKAAGMNMNTEVTEAIDPTGGHEDS